jgi:hypothetical protein
MAPGEFRHFCFPVQSALFVQPRKTVLITESRAVPVSYDAFGSSAVHVVATCGLAWFMTSCQL